MADSPDKTDVERLKYTLQKITDHFAAVMGGPLVTGQGIVFANGVEGIPTIAAARNLLAELS